MDLQTILLIILGVMLGVLLLLAGVAAFVWWRIQRSGEKKLAKRILDLEFRDKISLGANLFMDRRIPPWARIVSVALIVYLALPLDIIPDFIPVIGFLDDFLVVLIGAGVVLRSIPRDVLEEHVSRYEYIEGEARPATKRLPDPNARQ